MKVEHSPGLLWLNGAALSELLDMESVISAVRQAMETVSEGRTELPLRRSMALADSGNALGMMPGALLDSDPVFGIKLVSLFPGNPVRGLPSHTGIYALFEAQYGSPIALMDAHVLTSIRTAAMSAVASAALAREESEVLTLIGTGQQSEAHMKSIPQVRNIREIRVWGRNEQAAEQMAQNDHRARAVRDLNDAIKDSDILCTLTAACRPLIAEQHLSDGMHVNVVGSSHPGAMEIAPEALRHCKIFVDYRESARQQAGELLEATRAGILPESVFDREIGKLLAGKLPGRESPDEITLYKSLGIAAQDLVTARLALKRAKSRKIGIALEVPNDLTG